MRPWRGAGCRIRLGLRTPPLRRRVHFPRVERHDRFVGGQKPGGKVAPASGRSVIARVAVARWRTEEPAAVRLRARALRGAVRLGGLLAVLADRVRVTGSVRSRAASGSVANRSVPIRPVLKHGPRSLTCARVMGFYETQRRNESEGSLSVGLGRIPSLAAGALPARLVAIVGEAEQERTRWDPKDGELCLSRTKPEETLVEVRSDSDVQIDRQTWV